MAKPRRSFRRTVVGSVVGICALCVLGSSLIMAFMHFRLAREGRLQDDASLARIFASNSTAVLSFGDRTAGTEILSALSADRAVYAAVLRDAGGREFARYRQAGADDEMPWIARMIDTQRRLEQPVILQGQQVGTLELVTDDYFILRRLMNLYLWVLPVVLIILLALAYGLAVLLQRRIVRPLVDLLDVVRVVKERRDFSVRAPELGKDELGLFARMLNEMLARIQHQETELTETSRELATQVHKLQLEIRERERVQEEHHRIEHRLRETQRLESLGILAGGVAHDFNNLLAAIMGHASLATMTVSENSDTHDHLQKIESIAQRAAERCRQMLAYAGHTQILPEKIELNELAQGVVDLSQTTLGRRCQVQLNLDPDAPQIVGDIGQVRQALVNLMLNAAEAIAPGTGVIRLSTHSAHYSRAMLEHTRFGHDLPEGLYHCVEVSDSAVGMSPEVMERLFEPFFTTKFAGRGLGLAAVSGILRSHAGFAIVETKVGLGTNFTLGFPSISTNPSAMPESGRSLGWRGTGSALLVDDEPISREVMGQFLNQLGFTSIVARDGQECLRLFEEHMTEIRVVIVDILMPKMDGVDTVRALRAAGCEAPIILVSGYTEQDAFYRLPEGAVAAFLPKPFSLLDLARKLQGVFQGESLED